MPELSNLTCSSHTRYETDAEAEEKATLFATCYVGKPEMIFVKCVCGGWHVESKDKW